MIIRYANGHTIEGVLLSRNDKTMRVALRGGEDVAEFASVKGAWISEDLEPVQVRYEWQRQNRKPVVSEADCVCPKSLAGRLIQLLRSGDPVEIHNPAPFPASRLSLGLAVQSIEGEALLQLHHN